MLFVTYWELNENMPVNERLNIAAKLTSAGLFPPEGVKILQWITTPDGWGITLAEADSAAAISRSMEIWRMAGAGFFKSSKTAPAMQIDKELIDGFVEAGAQVQKLFHS